MDYKQRIEFAEKISKEIGIAPLIHKNTPMDAHSLTIFDSFCSTILMQALLERFKPGYWGSQCMNIAPQAFAILQHYGFPCELTYGEVNINGTNEFDTEINHLKQEWANGKSDTDLCIHVWLTIGKDYIVDPTISSRIQKYYDRSFAQNLTITGRANILQKRYRLKYLPMLVGAKYLERIAGIPLEYSVRP
ncbi:hypothetical protein [Pseudomonas sediminis]|uniref:Uncharacterized protein n=1 Tax=Pseudomonas sediminis TaxID=1691904 RepID=A0ABX6SJX6_9PSED|nr:hypothetical protein [Pseudomonas sediminis]QNH01928.1 hypothetical protein HNQ25_04100 [Pseudomonas sediminis]